jgi:hypothetical protein
MWMKLNHRLGIVQVVPFLGGTGEMMEMMTRLSKGRKKEASLIGFPAGWIIARAESVLMRDTGEELGSGANHSIRWQEGSRGCLRRPPGLILWWKKGGLPGSTAHLRSMVVM